MGVSWDQLKANYYVNDYSNDLILTAMKDDEITSLIDPFDYLMALHFTGIILVFSFLVTTNFIHY